MAEVIVFLLAIIRVTTETKRNGGLHMNWGIIGLGHIAHEFAEAMQMVRRIYGVSSRDYNKGLAFQEQYGTVKVYKSFSEMLEDSEIDIVYIATVNSLHYEQMMACLKAGKHVLCEKAIWGDFQELKAAWEFAQENNLVVAEAMTIYHMPLFKKIKVMIQENKLGQIKFVNADLGSLKEDDPNNRFFSKELGGGAMLDIGTYVLSFLRYFLAGEVTETAYTMEKYSTGVDEMWSISLKTTQQMLGNANMTFRAKLPKKAIIAGTKAYVTIDNYVRADRATITYPDGRCEEIIAGKTRDALIYEILDMEASVSDRSNDQTYIKETLDVVKLMDQLLTTEKLK